MIKNFSVIILWLLLTFCKSDVNSQDEVFYIIKEGSNFIRSERFKDNPPPPTEIVYGEFNFILSGKEKVYFHTVSHYHKCGFGKKRNDYKKLPFLELKPEQVKEIKQENFSSFLGSAIKEESLMNPKLVITISSSTDTVRNPAFKQITEYLANNLHRYNIRRITREEKYAISSKKNGVVYQAPKAFSDLGLDSSVVCITEN